MHFKYVLFQDCVSDDCYYKVIVKRCYSSCIRVPFNSSYECCRECNRTRMHRECDGGKDLSLKTPYSISITKRFNRSNGKNYGIGKNE